MKKLQVPIDEATARSLDAGDVVALSGLMVTARDAGHKYMVETLITGNLSPADEAVRTELAKALSGGAIYHCGPVVSRQGGRLAFVSAGPTTSSREEPYEAKVIEHFRVRAIVGKGGMGKSTLDACVKFGCVYLHAVGGAGTFIADAVKEVVAVHKEDFGTPEAFWVVRVEDFPAVVTMDSKGKSLHDAVKSSSSEIFKRLVPA